MLILAMGDLLKLLFTSAERVCVGWLDMGRRRVRIEAYDALIERVWYLKARPVCLAESTHIAVPMSRQQLIDEVERGRGWPRDKSLRAAPLEGATLSQAQFEGVDLREARLNKAKLWGANFKGALMHRVQLREANLLDADLSAADMERADLTGARLDRATLDATDLSGATLEGVSFEGATSSALV